jgi:hypothetical protein
MTGAICPQYKPIFEKVKVTRTNASAAFPSMPFRIPEPDRPRHSFGVNGVGNGETQDYCASARFNATISLLFSENV